MQPAGHLTPAPGGLLFPVLHLGGRPASSDTMSDSEEESQDRQLKIVVLGDGTSGKVSPPAGPTPRACRNRGRVRPVRNLARGAERCPALRPPLRSLRLGLARLRPRPSSRLRPVRVPAARGTLGWASTQSHTNRDDALAERARYTLAAFVVSDSHFSPILSTSQCKGSFSRHLLSSRGGQDVGGWGWGKTQGPQAEKT